MEVPHFRLGDIVLFDSPQTNNHLETFADVLLLLRLKIDIVVGHSECNSGHPYLYGKQQL